MQEIYTKAFEKGDKSVCACCGGKTEGAPHVYDRETEKALCINCVEIEQFAEFSDPEEKVWIPLNDAVFIDRHGNEITKKMQDLFSKNATHTELNAGALLDGLKERTKKHVPLPQTAKAEDKQQLRSLKAAIDMALDLGCKEDFIELSSQYNALLKKTGGDINGV